MLADGVQTFGVILVVLAAGAYLLLLLRRAGRRGCGCAARQVLDAGRDEPPACPAARAGQDRVPSRQIISPDALADRAKACREAAEAAGRQEPGSPS